MKQFYGLALLFGFYGLTCNAQYPAVFDTTFTIPGGGEIRTWGSFSGIIQDFDSVQRQLINQVASYQKDRNRFLREEAARVKQELENRRIAMFTNIIGFTTKEAEAFWPLYNEYLAKLDNIMSKRRDIVDKICSPYAKISVRESSELTTDYIASFKRETDLMTEYYNKYKTILDPQKLLLLYRAEYQFKIMILRSL